ncbi:hypothetical protein [Alteromonas sp. a30]|uniref:hypothetical protein n=1 Tax=Alteromonas sp. a30 TaxID=2730917 RepID=UPI002282A6A3|nr:hypothetical protein [Alteromonas sp. a30]MCY7294599.1 hypothetical protein [Alteromonas sp. a30]
MRSNGRYANKETVLTTLTSGNTATINVEGNTQIVGALIATLDDEGNDLGNLALTTGSLDFINLKERSYNSQTGFSVNANVGISEGANPTDPASQVAANPQDNDDTLNVNSSNISINTSTSASGGTTYATIGEGTVVVGDAQSEANLAAINRDVDNVTEELYNTETGMSVDATIDHRLFNENGQNAILEDFAEVAEEVKAGVKAIQRAISPLTPEEFEVVVEENKAEITLNIKEKLIEDGLTPEQAEAELAHMDGLVQRAASLQSMVEENPEQLANILEQSLVLETQTDENGIEHVTIGGSADMALALEVVMFAAAAKQKVDEFNESDAGQAAAFLAEIAAGPVGFLIGKVAETLAQTEPGQALLAKAEEGLEAGGTVLATVVTNEDSIEDFEEGYADEETHDPTAHREAKSASVEALLLVGTIAGVLVPVLKDTFKKKGSGNNDSGGDGGSGGGGEGPEGGVSTNSVDANSGEIFEPGLNITPNSTLNNYPSIGANGTFVTNSKTIEGIIGPVPDGATEIRITRQQANALESDLGLNPGSLEQSNTLSIVSDIPERCPRCPVGNAGNDLFLGDGEGLPGGGPELVIDSIPSAGGDGIRQITIIVED